MKTLEQTRDRLIDLAMGAINARGHYMTAPTQERAEVMDAALKSFLDATHAAFREIEAPQAPTALIVVSGGVVQGISATSEINVIVQDLDNLDYDEDPENPNCTHDEPVEVLTLEALQLRIGDNVVNH